MGKLLYFSETNGLGATVRLDSGEPCSVSISKGIRGSVIVKKSRFGFFGSVLYKDKFAHFQALKTADEINARFPIDIVQADIGDPVLRAFTNAILHCSSCREIATTLAEVAAVAHKIVLDPSSSREPNL